MKKFILAIALFAVASSPGALVELQDANEFADFVNTSKVPVVVQFSAYWCVPCQKLKGTMTEVAKLYTDAQVRIGYVDADLNPVLQGYLLGAYPTTRVFKNGTISPHAFVGNKKAEVVKAFIDNALVREDDSENFCPLN